YAPARRIGGVPREDIDETCPRDDRPVGTHHRVPALAHEVTDGAPVVERLREEGLAVDVERLSRVHPDVGRLELDVDERREDGVRLRQVRRAELLVPDAE